MSVTFVTEAFGLASPVPFIDVHVEKDNPFVIDPSRIRNGTDHYSLIAHGLLVDFFTEVLRCRLSESPSDQARGVGLLMRLNEPNETRFGYTVSGSRGHGFGPELGEELWNALESEVVRTKALTRLEELPIMLHRVGGDLISDMTTRIIFTVLVEFTTEMMEVFGGELASSAVERNIYLWDAALGWIERPVRLPFHSGRQLLLVPSSWTGLRLLMEPRPFYNRFATETLQEELTVYDASGRPSAPQKRQLKAENRDVKSLNVAQTVKWIGRGQNLLRMYRADADGRCVPLDSSAFQKVLGTYPMAS